MISQKIRVSLAGDIPPVSLPGAVDGLHYGALLAWACGVVTYHLLATYAADVGATLPALLLAGALPK